MNQISTIIILSCIKRKKEGEATKKLLEASIRASGLDVDVKISLDEKMDGVWQNYKNALKIKPSADERFKLIIHDDLIIGRQNVEKIIHILKFMPDDCFVGFYNPDNSGYKDAFLKGHRILKTHSNFWLQAFCFPSNNIEKFLKWADENIDDSYKWEDRRVGEYSERFDVPAYIVMPSMFQHLGAFRSTLNFSGIIAGRFKRWSNNFNPEMDVYNVNWTYEIRHPYNSEQKSSDNNLKKAMKNG